MTSVLRTAKRNLKVTLEAFSHCPSPSQMDALYDILKHLDAMAADRLEPLFFLSSLDPGVGKTRAIAAYLQALVENREAKGVGVILGLFKREEIKALVEACDLPKSSFAVFTSLKEYNDLGSPDRFSAQVLFTTQQRIAFLCRNSTFLETEAFFYRSHPRQVRIWDEAFLPALPIAISRDSLMGCLEGIRRKYPDQADGLDNFLKEVGGKTDGDVLDIPATESMFGVELEAVIQDRTVLTQQQHDLLNTLRFAGGHKALIRRPRAEDPHTLVTAVENLPHDLAPLLILDASGRVKCSYVLWEMHRRTLRRLKSPRKRYSGLTIHHWQKGGSRTSVQANPKPFVEAMSAVISDDLSRSSSSKWLVVMRKPKEGDKTDVWKELKTSLPSKHLDRVARITWGQHTATNAYADYTHAMLLGRARALIYHEAP